MDSPNLVKRIIAEILNLLPTSPFQPFIAEFEAVEWIGYINYFVPVGTFISIGSAWLVAIAVFYIYQVILRWVKVIN